MKNAVKYLLKLGVRDPMRRGSETERDGKSRRAAGHHEKSPDLYTSVFFSAAIGH